MHIPTTSLTDRGKRLYRDRSLLSRTAEDARSPAARTAAQTGVPVSFRHNAPKISRESFRLPNGVEVNKAKFEGFTSILADFERTVAADPRLVSEATKALGQRLLDLHFGEQREQHERLAAEYDKPHAQRWAETRKRWRELFAADPELGKNRCETTLRKIHALLDAYGKSAGDERLQDLKDFLNHSGLGDHLGMVRFLAWVVQHMPATGRRG